jgi:DNA-binding IclR family transcriptional regulator
MRTQAKSAARALDLLELVASNQTGLTFSELLAETDIPKSSLFELLTLLTERNHLKLDRITRRYTIAIKAWEVGQAFGQHRHLIDAARPAMDKIVATLNETTQLSILDGLENVYLAKVDCTHPVRLQTDVGKRFPAHATGVGKVLLSALSSVDLGERLRSQSLARLTKNTITSKDDLLDELIETQRRGFAVDYEEGTEGLRCVAVPIRGNDGVEAAMSASIPVFRADPPKMAAALRVLAEASLEIAQTLGALEDDPALTRVLLMDETEIVSLFEVLEVERGHSTLEAKSV